MKAFLVLFLCLIPLAFSERRPLSDTILHFEPVTSFTLTPLTGVCQGKELCNINALGRSRLSFEAFGRKFDHLIEPNHSILAPNAQVVTLHANGEESREPLTTGVFRGVGEDEWVVNVGFASDELVDLKTPNFRGVFHYEDDSFMAEPLENYLDEIPEASLKSLPKGTSMVIYRIQDQLDDQIYCGNGDYHHVDDHSDDAKINRQKKNIEQEVLDVLKDPFISPPASPCPTKLMNITFSVAIDDGYVTKANGSRTVARDLVIFNFESFRPIYRKTFNLNPNLQEIVFSDAAANPEWNTAVCPTINEKLNQFARWRSTRSPDAALWHLLTNCYPSGTVGLAWTGVPCMTDGFTQGTDYVNGASVASYLRGANGWRVSAHELGHNLGAGHAAEGIMYPSVRPTNDFSRASQNEVCAVLGRRNTDCLIDPGACPIDCSGKECGSDGCGGVCGTCKGKGICSSQGKCVCQPLCVNRECGSDGCSGTCGTCSGKETCEESIGQCLSTSSEDRVGLLNLHNGFRKNLVQPLNYSLALESQAEKWAKTCSLIHSAPAQRVGLGENMLAASGLDLITAVRQWGDEKKNWVCRTNECRGICGHYLQMVQETTTEVGCSLQKCGDVNFAVCLYSPGGINLNTSPFSADKCPKCDPLCRAEGAQCGSVFNGCEDEICGTCALGSFCRDNGLCTCLNRTSCVAEGKECGTLDIGCGFSPVSCGSCPVGKFCSGGKCLCESSKCGRENKKLCGAVQDSTCDVQAFSCGNCSSSSPCDSQTGKCGTCRPTTTCQAQNKTCGTIFDGCGTVSCGSCSSKESCVDGQCVCQPVQSCESRNKTCGRLFDGCNTVICGNCKSGTTCLDGVCRPCDRCHPFAKCIVTSSGSNGTCACGIGFRGDGINYCTRVGDIRPGTGIGRVKFLSGPNNVWFTAGDQTSHSGSSSLDVLQFDPVYRFDSRARTNFTAFIRRLDDSDQGGIAWMIQDSNNFFYFKHGPGNDLQFGVMYQGKTSEFPVASQPRSGSSAYSRIGIVAQGSKISFYFNYVQVGSTINMKMSGWSFHGGLGFFARGNVDFFKPATVTQSNLTLSLGNCLSNTNLALSLGKILDVNDGIVVTSSRCGSQPGPKRNVMQDDDEDPADLNPAGTYNVALYGSTTAASHTMTTLVEADTALDSVALTGNGAWVLQSNVDANSSNEPNTYNAQDSSSGLSVGAIVGIIIGVVVGLLIIIIVVVVIVKRSSSSSSQSMQPLYS